MITKCYVELGDYDRKPLKGAVFAILSKCSENEVGINLFENLGLNYQGCSNVSEGYNRSEQNMRFLYEDNGRDVEVIIRNNKGDNHYLPSIVIQGSDETQVEKAEKAIRRLIGSMRLRELDSGAEDKAKEVLRRMKELDQDLREDPGSAALIRAEVRLRNRLGDLVNCV